MVAATCWPSLGQARSLLKPARLRWIAKSALEPGRLRWGARHLCSTHANLALVKYPSKLCRLQGGNKCQPLQIHVSNLHPTPRCPKVPARSCAMGGHGVTTWFRWWGSHDRKYMELFGACRHEVFLMPFGPGASWSYHSPGLWDTRSVPGRVLAGSDEMTRKNSHRNTPAIA